MIRGARRAISRLVIDGYRIGWFVIISRVFLFDSHIHCFLLLLILFAFRSCHRRSTGRRSQALQGIVPEPT